MNENIILYSNGCPKCRVLETKLTAKKISYIKNENVSEVADMGFQSLPILKVDDKYLSFVEANDWVNNQPEQIHQPEMIQSELPADLVNACSVS